METEKEKIWTHEELNDVRLKVKAECWKVRDGVCDLGKVEMYEHDGGVFVKESSKKQWVYFTCRRCGYQWALHKLLRRLEEGDRI